jgi:hypothetical protein
LVNDFLHPEFSWIGGFSAYGIIVNSARGRDRV